MSKQVCAIGLTVVRLCSLSELEHEPPPEGAMAGAVAGLDRMAGHGSKVNRAKPPRVAANGHV
jgi:hypothetical protein